MLSSLATSVPTAYPRITSRQHPVVRDVRALARRRRTDPHVLLDGAHVLLEAIRARVAIQTVLVSSEFIARATAEDRAVLPGAARAGARIFEVSDAVLDAASPVRTPSGIVATAVWSPGAPATAFAVAPALAVGLLDVQDPGNVGAVIRGADAFGATGVIAIGETADPGGWKAIRAAMGSTFHLPVGYGSLDDVLVAARDRHLRVVATVAHDATPIDRADLRQPSLLLLGHEGAGLSPVALDHADLLVTVPMRDGVNSLNVAVTAALILYEARRQRVSGRDQHEDMKT